MTHPAGNVFVTGLGVVSSLGNDIESFWHACLDGRSPTEKIPAHWGDYYNGASEVWLPLHEPDYSQFGVTRVDLLTLGRPALIGIAAASQALTQAGIVVEKTEGTYPAAVLQNFDSFRAGIFVGTGLGAAQAPFNNYYTHLFSGISSVLQQAADLHTEDRQLRERLAGLRAHPRVNPMVICQTMPNAIAANLAIRFGVRGPVDTTCAACASSTIAIGKAFRAIQRGELDMAIAGGAEHLSDRAGGVFMGFDRLQTLAKPYRGAGTENRPFDRDRSGFLFSEGGASFAVLESAESLTRRSGRAIAEVVGFAETNDAFSIASIKDNSNAIEAMIDRALGNAGIPPEQIDYINAHGTGTEINDAVESRIIERKFGRQTRVNSSKSLLGHTIGAAGALEFAVTALSLERQEIHLCRNLENPIADLAFSLVSGPASLEYALTQNFGFGGHNAGLVLHRVQT